MKQKKVIAIGEVLVDLISTNFVNELSEAKSYQVFQGGSPANFCGNLLWLNTQAELIATVGNDGLGYFLLNQIKQIGINTDRIHVEKGIPTSLILVGKTKGTPDFLAYRMADKFIKIANMNWLEDASVLHTSAFALSLEPARTIILEAISLASKNGITISVDWNYAEEIWTAGGGQNVFTELIKYNPMLKFSLDDYCRFSGLNQASAEDAKDFLNGFQLDFCCLTCGAEGVWYRHKNENWIFEEAKPISRIADTTGAGDAFWAGFISGWLEFNSIQEGISRGLNIAAKKVETLGPLYLSRNIPI